LAFGGIESIEFIDNTVTTPEDTTLEGVLFSPTATTNVTQFVVGTTTYLAGDTAARTEVDLAINSDGSYTFTPAPNYNGPGPVMTYTTVDALNPLNSGTSSLKIAVEPVDKIQPECVICFTKGTLITTADGDILIEDLKVGDLILTLDRGLQPLRGSLCVILADANLHKMKTCDQSAFAKM
jgi:hypothetical protein